MRVVILGPLPAPIGGVASHVEWLATLLSKTGTDCTVIDAYPAINKVTPKSVAHKVLIHDGHFRAILWLSFQAWKADGDILHLHFSRLSGRFIPVALLTIRTGRKLVLTLHHGDQGVSYDNASWPVRFLARVALRRMDAIIALSKKQRGFYNSLGIEDDRMPYWPFVINNAAFLSSDIAFRGIDGVRAIEHGGNETILVTSGYPSRSYNYELCLKLLDNCLNRFSCRLIICLYGKGGDSEYEITLRARLAANPNVLVLGPMPSAEFLAVLAKASVYLRPTLIDSYGLAVTDALNVGTPSIASDICQRDERCETYPAGDEAAFLRLASALIERGRKLRRKPEIAKPCAGQGKELAAFYSDIRAR